uniref:(California timema) hypothetical protein n=1 Tax=Timema californicum TaxID=61474 RepID=A0A7R9J2Z6_TIMCA|nr:unnamed protein product [Timema californicum]
MPSYSDLVLSSLLLMFVVSSPDQDSNLDLPVLSSRAQHDKRVDWDRGALRLLSQSSTPIPSIEGDMLANALVVLSSTAEDGEIEVRISVG